jgi:hypothetical protein
MILDHDEPEKPLHPEIATPSMSAYAGADTELIGLSYISAILA